MHVRSCRHGTSLLVAVVVIALRHAPNGADTIATTAQSRPTTLYAVGDLMYRTTSEGAVLVGELMERLLAQDPMNSRAIVAGDVCNDNGEPECYERLEQTPWGRLRPLLFSVPGNHDYESATREGGIPYYFNYMLNAGDAEHGWHAFDWGGWRVIGLNSEAMRRDTDHQLSPIGLDQLAWLERELQQYAKDRCVLTYYHRPMYSSGRFASPAWVEPIFRKAFKHGVDLYFAAHEHMFAALPPLTPFRDERGVGVVDVSYGIPGIIGGTGGAILFPDPRSDVRIKPEERRLKWMQDGEVLLANVWGVTRIDLWPGAYQWTFIPAQPQPGVRYPSGGGSCHTNPPGYSDEG
jgi:acid phosphatase type 7